MPPNEGLATIERRVGALARTVRERVWEEDAVEERLDHAAERVVNNTVPERHRADLPPGRLEHDEVAVATGPIGPLPQLSLEVKEVALDVQLEARDVARGQRFA
jgi:hypothetical protein